MSAFEFVDELPPTQLSYTPERGKEFAAALRARPGQWAVWPYRCQPNPVLVCMDLCEGKFSEIPPSDFAFVFHEDVRPCAVGAVGAGTIYVRFDRGGAQ